MQEIRPAGVEWVFLTCSCNVTFNQRCETTAQLSRLACAAAVFRGLAQSLGFAGNTVLFQRPAKSLCWWLWHGRARVAETCLTGPPVLPSPKPLFLAVG